MIGRKGALIRSSKLSIFISISPTLSLESKLNQLTKLPWKRTCALMISFIQNTCWRVWTTTRISSCRSRCRRLLTFNGSQAPSWWIMSSLCILYCIWCRSASPCFQMMKMFTPDAYRLLAFQHLYSFTLNSCSSKNLVGITFQKAGTLPTFSNSSHSYLSNTSTSSAKVTQVL